MRLAADLVLLISIYLLPWWLVLAVGAIFLFLYDKYFELIAVGFIIDLVGSIPATGFRFTATSIAVMIFLLSLFKNRLSFYK